MTSFLFNVVLDGFEPPQTEPKPVVLPLHHRTMWMQSYNFLQKQPNETAFFFRPAQRLCGFAWSKEAFHKPFVGFSKHQFPLIEHSCAPTNDVFEKTKPFLKDNVVLVLPHSLGCCGKTSLKDNVEIVFQNCLYCLYCL